MTRGRKQTIKVNEILQKPFTLSELCDANPHIKFSSLTAYIRRETIRGNYEKIGVYKRNKKGKPPIIYSYTKSL